MHVSSVRSASSRNPVQLEPLARCCESHPDWPTLSQHLLVEFDDVAIEIVIREIRQAKEAVAAAGLDGPEALHTSELIVRHQLMLLPGRIVDIARLNPERHLRRSLHAEGASPAG